MQTPPPPPALPLRADRLPVDVRALVFSFLLLMGVIGAAIWGEQQVTAYGRAAFETQRRELETLRMLSFLQDTEIGQRGYLLTQNKDYLDLYRDALREIAATRARFNELTLDDRLGHDRAERLDKLISERLDGLRLGLEAFQRGDRQLAVDAMKRGGGKARMDEIRAIVGEINAGRHELLAAQQARLDRTIGWVHATEFAGAVLFVVLAVFIFRQSSATLEAQRRVRDSQDAALAAATSASRAKSAFLAIMSHELRTPMTAISGMSDLLLIARQGPEERRITELLAANARSLLRLLDDILDLSKIEAGRLTFDQVDFRLSAVLDEVRSMFAPVASQKGVVLDVAAGAGPRDVFRGDPKRIQQVLVNLVGNAIKFTSSGRITIANRQSPYGGDDILVEFEVRDTGEGISDEAMKRLFRDFEQEDASTSRRYGGSGLGLSISRRIVEAMGGAIGATSTKGRGSCFFFSLRLPGGDPGNVAARVSSSGAEAGRRLDGLSLDILLAEDTPATQFLIERMFSLWGHKVTTAANGEEAVRLANQRRWDVILMDMQMPVVDGPEAARLIRGGNGPCAHAPIIALTADAVLENRRGYLDAGCDVVATKPVDWAELADHIAALLVNRTPGASPRDAGSVSGRDVSLLNRPLLDELADTLGRKALAGLVMATLRNVRAMATELDHQVAAGDIATALRLAHQIKGAAAQFGAARAAETARLVETGLKSGASVSAATGQLIACLEESAAALAGFFETAADT